MKKITIIFTIFFLYTFTVSAQKAPRKIKDPFLEAYSSMQYGGYNNAVKYLKEIEEMGEINANVSYNMGLCYLNLLGDKSRAIPYLQKAVQKISKDYKDGSYKEMNAPPEALFYLAKAYRINMQLDKAIEIYQKYKKQLDDKSVNYHNYVDLQIQTCKNAKELIKTPIPLKKTNLGPTINDSDDNFNPVITPDGKTLIYTTLQRIFNEEDRQASFYEIINYTTKKNGKWQPPQDITSKINSEGYFNTVGISADGTQMYFFRDDYGDGNLYKAEKKGYRFTEIEELDREINSRDWESHISPGPDGKYYFASTQKGGEGGRDIYIIEKDKKGKWKDAKNIGKTINTPYDEDCPVISEDGKTLYFCSEAHNSMGGYDIFYSTKNSNGKWSTPLNIGYPINTTDDDIFFMPYKNGKYALFAHRDPDDTYGRKDIYKYQIKFDEDEEVPEVEVPQLAQQETPEAEQKTTTQTEETTQEITEQTTTETETVDEETLKEVAETVETKEQKTKTTEKTSAESQEISEIDIRGIILLKDSNEITSDFNVQVVDTKNNTIAGSATPDHNGKYSVTVPPGDYLLTFSGPGYVSHQQSVSIPSDYGLPKATVDVELTPKEVSNGTYVLMRGVLFNYNSSSLTRQARIKLEKLYNVMQENKQLYVEVTGFTDPSGNKAYNQKLANERASNVINYLVNKGIARNRFAAKSMGELKLLVSPENPNPEAQKYNRRVEINVLKTGNTKITYEEFHVPEHLKFGDRGLQLQYTILLTEAQKPLQPSHFNQVKEQGVSNVWIFPSTNGYFYTIGKYASKAKASQLLNKAVDMGFPNARIINYRELEQKKRQGKIASRKKLQAASQQNGQYTIQLIALKIPVETSYFKNLEGVRRIKGPDGLYRYIWGKFDHATAKTKRRKIMNMGYPGAFIMNLDYYEK